MFQLKQAVHPLLLLAVLSSAASAQAATYYVAENGSDDNDGLSTNTPFQTVKKGISMATSPGDVLYLRGGIYNQGDSRVDTNQISIYASGTAGNPITLASYPGETAVIKFEFHPESELDTQVWARIQFYGTTSYWIVDGLELDHTGLGIERGDHYIIHGNNCYGARGCIGGDLVDTVIDGNFMGLTQSHCMYISGTRTSVTNNVVYACAMKEQHKPAGGYGLQANGSGSGESGWTENLIANNTFVYNRYSGVVNWGPLATNNRYENNIFYENGVEMNSTDGGG